MPQPTTEYSSEQTYQVQTPGVGMQGPPGRALPPAPKADPVLYEDIDKVLLVRLFPEADSITDAAAQALAQGTATAAAGEALESSQYEPILPLPE